MNKSQMMLISIHNSDTPFRMPANESDLATLQALERQGFVRRGKSGIYAITTEGRIEARRLFRDKPSPTARGRRRPPKMRG